MKKKLLYPQATWSYLRAYGRWVKKIGLLDPSVGELPRGLVAELNRCEWHRGRDGMLYGQSPIRRVHIGIPSRRMLILLAVRPIEQWASHEDLEPVKIVVVGRAKSGKVKGGAVWRSAKRDVVPFASREGPEGTGSAEGGHIHRFVPIDTPQSYLRCRRFCSLCGSEEGVSIDPRRDSLP